MGFNSPSGLWSANRGFESRRMQVRHIAGTSISPAVWSLPETAKELHAKACKTLLSKRLLGDGCIDLSVQRDAVQNRPCLNTDTAPRSFKPKVFFPLEISWRSRIQPPVLHERLYVKLLFGEVIHTMKKIIINENQKGFLFKNGKFIKLLDAGKYRIFGDKRIEISCLDQPLGSEQCALDTLLSDGAIADRVSVVEVSDMQLALHFVNGKFSSALRCGKYAFWSVIDKHEYRIVDISTPEVDISVPEYIFSIIPSAYYIKIEVAQYQKARLYFNQKFERILDAGTYYFWKTDVKVDVDFVDTRLTRMDITGQEILTQDKVSLRINFVCNYRISDYVKIMTEVDDFSGQMHVAAQLALREYVGKYKLDDILENKDRMSRYVFDRLKSKEQELYVEIIDAGVKDIILPGEIREIMNTVLVAEKRAQANVITRREEVASTRSLLNTAKLMEENQTLYKLKELEYIERICENVGNITLGGSGDVLSQLMALLRGSAS